MFVVESMAMGVFTPQTASAEAARAKTKEASHVAAPRQEHLSIFPQGRSGEAPRPVVTIPFDGWITASACFPDGDFPRDKKSLKE
jgi:hypothetical protein